jgi:protein-L-isoaspartate(D-aspartate) O-methyltransferase
MIAQHIRPWEVLDPRVLAVLDEIDRADFVGEAYKGLAYADCQIPVADGVRMLPPTVEGRMLQALTIEPGDRILEIGSGSGYVTACLARLGQRVTSLDTRQGVIDFASANITACGIGNVEFAQRAIDQIDDDQAWEVIAVTRSLPAVPDNLRRALKTGGRMFVVTGDSPVMEALLITRLGESEWTTQSLFETDLPRLGQ